MSPKMPNHLSGPSIWTPDSAEQVGLDPWIHGSKFKIDRDN